jgi:LacI family transcriptional regulator
VFALLSRNAVCLRKNKVLLCANNCPFPLDTPLARAYNAVNVSANSLLIFFYPMLTSRATIAEVARRAGVSMMTVSRVVNDKDGVSPATRQRIRLIITELGYRPSGIARGLATQRTGTLGLVVPDVANPFFADVVRGAEQIAYQQGYSLLLCNTEEDSQRELDVLQLLEEKRVDGIVLCSSRLGPGPLRQALAHYPAVVLVNQHLMPAEGTSIVGAVLQEDEMGGQMAASHLIHRGHRSIGCLSGPAASFSGQRRVGGYRLALEAAGIDPQPGWTQPCRPTVEGGLQAGRLLLNQHPELTALFCFNDLVAVGVLQAAAVVGLRVPDDLAVVGYDDIHLAVLVTPPLTTCRIDRETLGGRATSLLIQHLSGIPSDSRGCETITLKPELIIRASAP